MPGVLSHVHVSDGFGDETPDVVHPIASIPRVLTFSHVCYMGRLYPFHLLGEYKAHARQVRGSQIMG